MATFHFDLVSPEKMAFSGEVDQVDIPGVEGDFGVLAGHAPVVADGGLRGIVSIGDVVKNRIDELETERAALTDYITGPR